ncbi:MAG TPA: flagellar motor protein MotD [Gammaproteobacteria bacterium]|nr:flagellar motor protein MotD [Gammaproteobacteria bacterium]
MSRKKRTEEHENHERWLVSYADFITLLFAFFVVMYSVSQVNEGKYKVLSGSLEAAFRTEPKSMAPIQVGQPGTTAGTEAVAVLKPAGESAIQTMARDIEAQIKPLVEQGLITLRQTDDWLEIEINNRILFPSGSTKLVSDAKVLLSLLGGVLGKFSAPVQVEGYTDNVPINTPVFPSNWELSAARAATVAHLLSQHGIDPELLAAIGYGENRPITSNDTPDGRSQNRRVVLKIFKTGRSSTGENNIPAPAISAEPLAEGAVQ